MPKGGGKGHPQGRHSGKKGAGDTEQRQGRDQWEGNPSQAEAVEEEEKEEKEVEDLWRHLLWHGSVPPRPLLDPSQGKNFLFYSGQIPSSPQGAHISHIHSVWKYDDDLLEMHHGYIQWLFPLFKDSGMNWNASALDKGEAALIRRDPVLSRRVLESYRVMLHFYGLHLVNEGTGEVTRHPQRWRARYRHLNRSFHNYLRITRILTSLGQLGFFRYRQPLVNHFAMEVFRNNELGNCEESLVGFWRPLLFPNARGYRDETLEDPEDRGESVLFTHRQWRDETRGEETEETQETLQETLESQHDNDTNKDEDDNDNDEDTGHASDKS